MASRSAASSVVIPWARASEKIMATVSPIASTHAVMTASSALGSEAKSR